MPPPGVLDYVLLGLVLASALVGLFRGIFREAMSLVVWVAAVWASARYAADFAPHLAPLVANAQLRVWAARFLLLIGVLIAGGIITWLIAAALHRSHLGATDRVVGMVFGLARGVVLAGLVVITLKLAGFSDEPWWRESKLIPYAAPVTDALRQAAEGFGWSWSSRVAPLPRSSGSPFSFRS